MLVEHNKIVGPQGLQQSVCGRNREAHVLRDLSEGQRRTVGIERLQDGNSTVDTLGAAGSRGPLPTTATSASLHKMEFSATT
jgi:hypothetical protein